MKLGVVGLPNVGKSTLFNALTQAGAQSANYPFCTIEPNYGIVSVPDARMDYLAQIYHPQKFTPAQIEFVDIAGLVKGASKGEGLGNKFLSHIREVDAIIEVVRCFEEDVYKRQRILMLRRRFATVLTRLYPAVNRKLKLLFPVEVAACFAHPVIPVPGIRIAFCKVCGVRRNLGSDNTLAHIVHSRCV